MQKYRDLASEKKFISELENIRKKEFDGARSIFESFRSVEDDFWLWAHTSGYQKSRFLQQWLPRMPERKIQREFTGASGKRTMKKAFLAYQLFKTMVHRYGEGIKPESKILDFGCGWGRLIRFFLKDVEAANLFGVDCCEPMIDLCKHSNLYANFLTIDPTPPLTFADKTFDVIFAFSVFSHLPEGLHKGWLREFSRILKPGGVFIATTRPRSFILRLALLRFLLFLPHCYRDTTASISQARAALSNYDNGKYCFIPCSDKKRAAFYGEACIPAKYVREVWNDYFHNTDFMEGKKALRESCQHVIVAWKNGK